MNHDASKNVVVVVGISIVGFYRAGARLLPQEARPPLESADEAQHSPRTPATSVPCTSPASSVPHSRRNAHIGTRNTHEFVGVEHPKITILKWSTNNLSVDLALCIGCLISGGPKEHPLDLILIVEGALGITSGVME